MDAWPADDADAPPAEPGEVEDARFMDAADPAVAQAVVLEEGLVLVDDADVARVEPRVEPRRSDDDEAVFLDANPDGEALEPARELPMPGHAPAPGWSPSTSTSTSSRAGPAGSDGVVAAGVGRYTGARGEIALPPRFALRGKPPDPTGGPAAAPPPSSMLLGCPACGVTNVREAVTCYRCGGAMPVEARAPEPVARGSELPDALFVPGALQPGAAFSPGASLAMRPDEREVHGGSLDGLPPEVQAQIRAMRWRNKKHTIEAVLRKVGRIVFLVLAMVVVAGGGGLLLSWVMSLRHADMVKLAGLDVALAVSVALWLELTDSSSLQGVFLGGAAAVMTVSLRLSWGGKPDDIVALFAMMLWVMGGIVIGYALSQGSDGT